MYTLKNYVTKKALKADVKAGIDIPIYQPGPFGFDTSDLNGHVSLEGPHYPEAHKWYARALVRDGLIVSVE